MAMRNGLSCLKAVCKINANPKLICSRLSSNMASSPVYELRMYAIKADKFKTAMALYNEHSQLRLKHSKLFGFFTSEIGGSVTQFVHIWEYDSLSHRRTVRTKMAGDETWNNQFLSVLLSCVDEWKNFLMLQSPDSKLNTEFTKDPSAVYLLDQVNVPSYKGLSDPEENKGGELLVGRFCGIMGPSKTEYRLWRYADINEATEGSKRRAMGGPKDETPFVLSRYFGSGYTFFPFLLLTVTVIGFLRH